ncbi:MAG: N-acetylneuraminate synthase family protein [Candidatus Riflebacteria bacterium]|nr:N-acetylneuraminate synthase family protein [Candidatus Riflebacteria bacterium]
MQTEPIPIVKHVFIIAEIGINHNGDLKIAKELIDLAKNAGCDAVKFQKRTIDIVYSKDFLDSPRESPWGNTQRDQKVALEFEESEYDVIDAYCREQGIDWFASAWDIPSQMFLSKYNLKYNKIASALLTNRKLLEAVSKQKKVTFISTGMSTLSDIRFAVNLFNDNNCPYILMHSVSEYPCKDDSLNLQVIEELRKKFNCPVGYSGHEVSVSPSVFAAAWGAVAIERHITLNRAMYGSDQSASLEKSGLELMVGQIRKIPLILKTAKKCISVEESKNAKKLRYWLSL